MFVSLTELSLILLISVTALTQILIPLWQEKPLFPLFRKKSRVEEELPEVNSEFDLIEKKIELKAKKQMIDQSKNI